jgi:hypothetical protein
MRFHVVCNPTAPKEPNRVVIQLRDANKPANSDEQISLVWTRENASAHFKFAEVAVGSLNISELQGTARMIRAVDSISFERGKDSLLRLSLVDCVNALIGENSTQAVWDPRFERFFAVNALRKEKSIAWTPDCGPIPEKIANALCVSAVTEEIAQKCITNELMRLCDAEETETLAQTVLMAWIKNKRKVIGNESTLEAPKVLDFEAAYTPVRK